MDARNDPTKGGAGQRDAGMGWGRFAAMIGTSTVIMFFLMYQLVYRIGDATFSLNRLVASLVMACVMAVVMLGFMWPMYRGKALKIGVVVAGIAGATGLIMLNRQQSLIDDARFMSAMIPHHSIAINNASRARIADPRVRALADGIIRSQLKEIAAMQMLLDDLDRNGAQGTTPLPATPAVLTPDLRAEAEEMAR